MIAPIQVYTLITRYHCCFDNLNTARMYEDSFNELLVRKGIDREFVKSIVYGNSLIFVLYAPVVFLAEKHIVDDCEWDDHFWHEFQDEASAMAMHHNIKNLLPQGACS